MTRSYAREMTKLADTFEWAATADLDPLRRAGRTAGLSSLRAVGSGGSLTGAHALAGLHQRYTGHLAAVATPLEAVGESLARETQRAFIHGWRLAYGVRLPCRLQRRRVE